MLGFTILDVVIGLAVVFFLLSIVCSAIVELLASRFRWRAKNLSAAISSLFQDNTNLLKAFYDHPQIWALSPDPRNPSDDSSGDDLITGDGRPSYLAAGTFTDVLVDMMTAEAVPPAIRGTFAGVNEVLHTDASKLAATNPAADNDMWRVLTAFASDAIHCAPDASADADARRLAQFKASVEQWYHEMMERATGWYKQQTRGWLLLFGLLLAFAVNIDAIAITQGLYANPKLREQTDAVAQRLVQQGGISGGSQQQIDLARQDLQNAAAEGMPMGWSTAHVSDLGSLVFKVLGLAMTGICVSFGAPFWFDLLNKLVNLRSAGEKPNPPAAATEAGDGTSATTIAAAPALSVVTSSGPVVTAAIVSPAAALPDNYWTQSARSEDLKGIDWSASTYTARKAAALARASSLAYHNGEAIKTVAKLWGIPDGQVQFLDCNDTEASVVWNDEIILVAFRGTEPTHLLDIISDAECSLVKAEAHATGNTIALAGANGKVHFGFITALDCVLTQLDAIVGSAIIDAKPQKLWITGHSLGAALATLYTARIQAAKGTATLKGIGVTGLYTFGSPRVGNSTFVSGLATATSLPLATGDDPNKCNTIVYRFINHEDMVTRVPPRAMGYDHIGWIMYLEANGTLEQGQSAGWIRFLNTFVDALNDLKATAGLGVKDHSIDLYLQKLENLAAA